MSLSIDSHSERPRPVAHVELESSPLSAQERSRLRQRWQAAWPSTVVLASSVCLVIIPLLMQSKTRRSWNEIANVADPAISLTTEIQLALALELARAEAEQIEINRGMTSLAAVKSDAPRVHQIVTNLVSNAVNYTPPNEHIEVTVRARVVEDTPGRETGSPSARSPCGYRAERRDELGADYYALPPVA